MCLTTMTVAHHHLLHLLSTCDGPCALWTSSLLPLEPREVDMLSSCFYRHRKLTLKIGEVMSSRSHSKVVMKYPGQSESQVHVPDIPAGSCLREDDFTLGHKSNTE